MGLTPVSANLLGLGNSALYPSGVGRSAQPATPSTAGATLPTDTARLSPAQANPPGGSNAGVYDVPGALIFKIQFDRLAFDSGQALASPTSSDSVGATSNTIAADAADGTGGEGNLRKDLKALGLDPKIISEFLRIGKLLKRFDPAAYRDFVKQLEYLANALQASESTAANLVPSSAAASAAATVPQPQAENAAHTAQQAQPSDTAPVTTTGTPHLQVDFTSFQLTETQIQITDTQGKNGQTLDVSAETLNVNFTEFQAAGAPQSSGENRNPADSQSPGSRVNVNA